MRNTLLETFAATAVNASELIKNNDKGFVDKRLVKDLCKLLVQQDYENKYIENIQKAVRVILKEHNIII